MKKPPTPRVPRVLAPINIDAQAIHLFRLQRLKPEHPLWAQSLAGATLETLRKIPVKKRRASILARIAELQK